MIVWQLCSLPDGTGKYELRPAVKKFYHLRFKVSASRVSVASRVVKPIHDELRPAVKKFYQLLTKLSASRVSVASRVVNPIHDELRPAVSKELYQLHRKIWVHKKSKNWKVLTPFYCTLLYTQLYAHIQNSWMIDIDNTVVISCYCLMFSPIKKSFRGRRQALYVPNIAHFKLLLWSDENTVSGEILNAVSLGITYTRPPNCAPIVIIHSAESPVW
jgi:hypothetical protein